MPLCKTLQNQFTNGIAGFAILYLNSAPSSCTVTPSFILMSTKRFSQGRTAIHLSNQFQPQLFLSGSNPPEETGCCLDPACHCQGENLKNLTPSLWTKTMYQRKMDTIMQSCWSCDKEIVGPTFQVQLTFRGSLTLDNIIE